MCGLIREKFQLHNDQVQTTELIKLIDDSGRVIGMYTASEARKKAKAMNLDMILLNKSISPIICKAVDFRRRLLTKFYEDIVVRTQKKGKNAIN
jgi:translation initiation factor IF-3